LEWNEKDSENLKTTIEITRQVEKTHMNLSFPVIFAKLCDLGNMGCFIIADRGKGKDAVLNTLIRSPLQHRTILKVGVITFKGLRKIADKINNKSTTVINHDISTLYTDYLKDVALNVFCQLLYDKRLDEMHSAEYDLHIEEAEISFLSGVQPKMYRSISKLSTFEGMYRDRIIRYFMLYPMGTPEYKPFYPTIQNTIKITNSEVTIPKELRLGEEYNKMEKIMKWQTSEGRGGEYLNRLLTASAKLNQRETVTMSDLKWLSLVIPNLIMERDCSIREGVSEPLIFNPNSYTILFEIIEKKEVTRQQLMEKFQVSNRTLTSNIKPLIGRRIISGKFGSRTYHIHPEYEKTYLEPVREWMKTII
jgi:hypothetical protein